MQRAELQGHAELEGAEAVGAERGNLLRTEVPPYKEQEGNLRKLGECGRRGGGPPKLTACELHSLPEASVFIFASIWVSIFCHNRDEDNSVGRISYVQTSILTPDIHHVSHLCSSGAGSVSQGSCFLPLKPPPSPTISNLPPPWHVFPSLPPPLNFVLVPRVCRDWLLVVMTTAIKKASHVI